MVIKMLSQLFFIILTVTLFLNILLDSYGILIKKPTHTKNEFLNYVLILLIVKDFLFSSKILGAATLILGSGYLIILLRSEKNID